MSFVTVCPLGTCWGIKNKTNYMIKEDQTAPKYLMKKKRKKNQTRKRNKQMIMIKKKEGEKRKNKLSSWKTNMLLKRDDFQLFFGKIHWS